MKHRKSFIALGGTVLAAGAAFAALWWRKNPSACPYALRFFVEMPRFLTRSGLREVLAPRPGEKILEVGPGTGYYSLDVAGEIAPDGVLDLLDVQQDMLDHTMRKAREESLTNLTATCADAADMPYPDDAFDAAFLVAVLGEVPDRRGAIRELRRVLKSGGRLVVGEAITDPHCVLSKELRALATEAGFRFVRESGGALGRFYLFV